MHTSAIAIFATVHIVQITWAAECVQSNGDPYEFLENPTKVWQKALPTSTDVCVKECPIIDTKVQQCFSQYPTNLSTIFSKDPAYEPWNCPTINTTIKTKVPYTIWQPRFVCCCFQCNDDCLDLPSSEDLEQICDTLDPDSEEHKKTEKFYSECAFRYWCDSDKKTCPFPEVTNQRGIEWTVISVCGSIILGILLLAALAFAAYYLIAPKRHQRRPDDIHNQEVLL